MRLSNEIEFLKMKGYSATPKIVQMEVTRECPLSCPQCYKDLSGKKHMDIEISRDICNLIQRTQMSRVNLTFF